MTRDYSKEIHEAVMQIYKDFDALLKIVGDCRKEIEAPPMPSAEEERKAALLGMLDKVNERKNGNDLIQDNKGQRM